MNDSANVGTTVKICVTHSARLHSKFKITALNLFEISQKQHIRSSPGVSPKHSIYLGGDISTTTKTASLLGRLLGRYPNAGTGSNNNNTNDDTPIQQAIAGETIEYHLMPEVWSLLQRGWTADVLTSPHSISVELSI